MILAGTGSRSLQTADICIKKEVYITTENLITNLRPDKVMSGMAEGFDHCLAMVALRMQIPLIAAVPNPGYGRYYWQRNSLTNTDQFDKFKWLLDKASEIIYVSDSIYQVGPTGERIHANFVRNQYMVDNADHFLVYSPESRGTQDCLKRIIKADKPYDVIDVN